MTTVFRRRQVIGWSCLSGLALVFVLLPQSVYSYEPVDYEDSFNILVESEGDVRLSNDSDFPDRVLDTSKVKLKLEQFDRQVILFEHNIHRRTTRPLASNMVFMVWSLNLQQQAKVVVDSCNETYELSRDGQAVLGQWFSSVGINTWMESAMYRFLVANVIHQWTEQKSFYSFDRNTCRLGKQCSQYIQVIWATASHIGCELNFCDTLHTASLLDRYNLYYVACIYGEGLTRRDDDGNYLKPFTNGTQCQDCPTGFSDCADGLCQTKPPCETVVDCTDIPDKDYCLCDKSTYDRGHRPTTFHWMLIGIWFSGTILPSFMTS